MIHPSDMFAVMIKERHGSQWTYLTGIYSRKTEDEAKEANPTNYLLDTKKEANSLYFKIITDGKWLFGDEGGFIKIQRMNRWNLRSAAEVIGGTFREIK